MMRNVRLQEMILRSTAYSLILFLMFSCNKDNGVFSNWENKISHKKLQLKNAQEKDHGKLVLSDDCSADLKLQGKKHFGDIHVGHIHGDCSKSQMPTKMNYKVTQKGLKVCSDFKSGAHKCEMLREE